MVDVDIKSSGLILERSPPFDSPGPTAVGLYHMMPTPPMPPQDRQDSYQQHEHGPQRSRQYACASSRRRSSRCSFDDMAVMMRSLLPHTMDSPFARPLACSTTASSRPERAASWKGRRASLQVESPVDYPTSAASTDVQCRSASCLERASSSEPSPRATSRPAAPTFHTSHSACNFGALSPMHGGSGPLKSALASPCSGRKHGKVQFAESPTVLVLKPTRTSSSSETDQPDTAAAASKPASPRSGFFLGTNASTAADSAAAASTTTTAAAAASVSSCSSCQAAPRYEQYDTAQADARQFVAHLHVLNRGMKALLPEPSRTRHYTGHSSDHEVQLQRQRQEQQECAAMRSPVATHAAVKIYTAQLFKALLAQLQDMGLDDVVTPIQEARQLLQAYMDLTCVQGNPNGAGMCNTSNRSSISGHNICNNGNRSSAPIPVSRSCEEAAGSGLTGSASQAVSSSMPGSARSGSAAFLAGASPSGYSTRPASLNSFYAAASLEHPEPATPTASGAARHLPGAVAAAGTTRQRQQQQQQQGSLSRRFSLNTSPTIVPLPQPWCAGGTAGTAGEGVLLDTPGSPQSPKLYHSFDRGSQCSFRPGSPAAGGLLGACAAAEQVPVVLAGGAGGRPLRGLASFREWTSC